MEVIGRALNGSLPFYQELHDASQTLDADGVLKLSSFFTKIGKRCPSSSLFVLGAEYGRPTLRRENTGL